MLFNAFFRHHFASFQTIFFNCRSVILKKAKKKMNEKKRRRIWQEKIQSFFFLISRSFNQSTIQMITMMYPSTLSTSKYPFGLFYRNHTKNYDDEVSFNNNNNENGKNNTSKLLIYLKYRLFSTIIFTSQKQLIFMFQQLKHTLLATILMNIPPIY